MIQRTLALILTAVLFAVPLAAWIGNPSEAGRISSLDGLERYLAESIPLSGQLHDLAGDITILSGQSERNGLFYTEDGLMENYWPADSGEIGKRNTSSIIRFAQKGEVPTFSVIIPTAVAVKQKQAPELAPLYNQKLFIEEVSRQKSGQVTAIDVYPSLYQRYDATGDYLYYRTDPAPTALGGYLIYREIAERMRFEPESLRDFDKEYPVHGYYGSLYDQWNYHKVEGDILTVYRPREDQRGYEVTARHSDGRSAAYRTLFPLHQKDLGNPYGIYLGGDAFRVDIRVTDGAEEQENLLVFGDFTAASYLPFLLLHFGNTTLVDLSRMEEEDLEEITLADYDRVLFAYSLDRYLDSEEIQKASILLKESS